jgi:hypothetical protein
MVRVPCSARERGVTVNPGGYQPTSPRQGTPDHFVARSGVAPAGGAEGTAGRRKGT